MTGALAEYANRDMQDSSTIIYGKSGSSNTLQRRISALDKSTEPFSVQVLEAFQILHIETNALDITYSQKESLEQLRHGFGPKEEWALRWLLKRLNVESRVESPSLVPNGWILLRILIARLPVAITARLLEAHALTSIIARTLQWLCEHTQQEEKTKQNDAPVLISQSADESSSSATVQETVSGSETSSRKRSRARYERDTSRSEGLGDIDVSVLYSSILSVINQIKARTIDVKSGEQQFAVEHLKSTLKCSLDQASTILGNSLDVVSYVMATLPYDDTMVVPFSTYNLLSPIILLWDLRLVSSDDASELSASKAFSTACLLPALRLLMVSNEILDIAGGMQSAIGDVTRLLATHIILPARATFLRDVRVKSRSTGNRQPLVEELLMPLAQLLRNEITPGEMRADPNMITLLLEIATRHSRQSTPKQRMTDSPWFQALFHHLTDCANLLSPTTNPSSKRRYLLNTLKRMLRVFLERKISMAFATLEEIVLRTSGLSSELIDPQIDWDLISLCLKIDQNLLTIPAPPTDSIEDRSSNVILTSLLAKVTSIAIREPSNPQQDYQALLEGIVLFFLDAFDHARDLPGFLKIWSRQISQWRSSLNDLILNGTCTEASESVWEDDTLLHAVSARIGTSLSTAQISRILEELSVNFTNSVDPDDGISSNYHANTVVLECFLDGIRSENAISASQKIVLFVSERVLNLVLDDTRDEYRWRLWRILNLIVAKWPRVISSLSEGKLQERVVHRAQVQLAKCFQDHSAPLTPLTYQQDFYAFRFMLILSDLQISTGLKSPMEQILSLTISEITKCMKRRVISSADLEGSPEILPKFVWDGARQSIKTQDVLILACIAQIILVPRCLHLLTHQSVQDLLSRLHFFAFWQKYTYSMTTSSRPTVTVDYLGLWEDLLSSDEIEETTLLSRCLSETLIAAMLNTKYTCNDDDKRDGNDDDDDDGSPGMIKSRVHFTIPYLKLVPFTMFSHEQRARIAQIADLGLLEKQTVYTLPLIVEYICILVCCVEQARKPFFLLARPYAICQIAESLPWSGGESNGIDMAILIRSFRQLVGKTLDHMFQKNIAEGQFDDLQVLIEYSRAQIYKTNAASTSYAELTLGCVLAERLWSFRSDIRMNNQQIIDIIATYRKMHFKWLLESLPALSAADPIGNLGCVLDGLLVAPELLECTPIQPHIYDNMDEQQNRKTVWEYLSKIVDVTTAAACKWFPTSSWSSSPFDPYEVMVLARKVALLRPTQDADEPVLALPKAIAELNDVKKFTGKRTWLQHIEERLEKLGPDSQASLVTQLVQETRELLDDVNTLLLLRRLLNQSHVSTGKAPEMKFAMMQCFSTLCEVLQTTRTIVPKSSILQMHCINIMLRKNTWTVSQWHIDSLLSMITLMTSASGPQFNGGSSGDIYMCLCRLLGSMLASHRAKLGGRYHLLVPALQGLLRCLFEPYVKGLDATQGIKLPPWTKNMQGVLGDRHAAAYSRLLTTICDPTVSAITGSKNRKRQDLNDETKKVRSIAGQHLQYLIMEFCQCQLKGRMTPELRTALNPGLYAIFDTMRQDTMRTINATLDPSGRAIFKVTYEDYRKFGKWKGN